MSNILQPCLLKAYLLLLHVALKIGLGCSAKASS